MSDCCNKISLEDAIDLLKEHQGVMQSVTDKLTAFVNGGKNQTVILGDTLTPTLRNLAQQLVDTYIRVATKNRLGVVQIGDGLDITESGVLSLDSSQIDFSSGNALTATKWAAAITLSLTGAVTGSGAIDGSGNVSIATTGAAAGLGFTQSLAASGWQKLPSGLILQWGEYKAAMEQNYYDVTFPIAFPKACVGIYPVAFVGATGTESGMQVSSWTKAKATLFCQVYVPLATAPPGFCWFAVGH